MARKAHSGARDVVLRRARAAKGVGHAPEDVPGWVAACVSTEAQGCPPFSSGVCPDVKGKGRVFVAKCVCVCVPTCVCVSVCLRVCVSCVVCLCVIRVCVCVPVAVSMFVSVAVSA